VSVTRGLWQDCTAYNVVDLGMLVAELVVAVPWVVEEERLGREECAAVPGDEDRTMAAWRSGELVVDEDEEVDDWLILFLVSSA
jgi:hypothetical protein